MALGVGAYFGEGAYLKKYGIPRPKQKIYQQKVFLNDLYTKQDFLGYEKYRVFNGREKVFFREVYPNFLQKCYIYRFFYFSAKQVKKKCLKTIYIENKTFQTLKTFIFEWSRNGYFRKGLTYHIGQKLQIFNLVLFRQNRCKNEKNRGEERRKYV